ncbi:MAG TPA: Na+/H+ antiporter subunit B, partial [Anaerolinea sp.]|nr:Na+/H+ antiporter subunit B [Anaerolinea sp.]
GFDTLGEISVLAIAAIGVYALINCIEKKPDDAPEGQISLKRSILLELSARYMMPLIMVFSVFLLIRGHNEVGGGFVAGLVAASALMLYAIAISPDALRRLLPFQPRTLVGGGLLIALISGLISSIGGQPFMTGLWLTEAVVVIGKVGTPILFDLGVYVLVIGIVLWIMLTFSGE